jgi:hypothetical protein
MATFQLFFQSREQVVVRRCWNTAVECHTGTQSNQYGWKKIMDYPFYLCDPSDFIHRTLSLQTLGSENRKNFWRK